MCSRIQKSSQKASGLTCICASCGKHLRDKHSLGLHKMAKHASEFYPCSNCDEHFFQKSDLNKHVEQMHKEIKPKCEECGHTFASVRNYKVHKNSYHGTFPCSYNGCKIKASTLENLNKHIDVYHFRKFTCKICETSFGYKCNLTVHMDVAHADRSCSCPVEGCDAKFLHPFSLRAHTVRVHEIKFHPKTACKLCGHDFKGIANSLRNHMKTIHWLDSFKEKFGKSQKEGEDEDVPEGHFAPMKLSIRSDA